MRSLNLDQLRTFSEVIARGNFSAAARRLNLTQPAVSLHIRELEQRFGVRLIERMGRRAYATAPGIQLLEHAERIFRESDAVASTMRRFRDGWLGRVHVGTTLTALTYQLPQVMRRLRTDYPGIDLLVTNMPTRDSIENIMNNSIDLALVTLPVKGAGLRIIPLRPEQLVAIFPADTKDVPDVVTPDYVAQQRLVLEHARGAVNGLVTQWLSKQLPLPENPMLVATVEAIKKLVALSSRNVHCAGCIGHGSRTGPYGSSVKTGNSLHVGSDRTLRQAQRTCLGNSTQRVALVERRQNDPGSVKSRHARGPPCR